MDVTHRLLYTRDSSERGPRRAGCRRPEHWAQRSRALEQLALLGLGLELELLVRLVHVRVVGRVGGEVLAPVVDQQLLPGRDLADGLDPDALLARDRVVVRPELAVGRVGAGYAVEIVEEARLRLGLRRG